MGKKSRKKEKTYTSVRENVQQFSEDTEIKFKLMLKIMSWVVGICFVLIIILPNFHFFLVDVTVKILFFLGVINLLLFAIFEFFSNSIKKLINKIIV